MFADNPTAILIIIVVVAVVFAIGAYQLVINKYYWGPKGRPPEEKGRKRDSN